MLKYERLNIMGNIKCIISNVSQGTGRSVLHPLKLDKIVLLILHSLNMRFL